MKKDIDRKIKALLAMAERAGSEQEMQTAMEKLQLLLAKHNLSMSEAEALGEPEAEQVDRSFFDAKQRAPWADRLWMAAARLYFCKGYVSKVYGAGGMRTPRKRYVLVGKASNVAIASQLGAYLQASCDRFARQAPADWDARSFRASFRHGFADRVSERVDQLIAEARANKLKDEATGRELILRPVYDVTTKENADFLRGAGVRLQSSRSSRTIRSGDGYHAGGAAADRVSLRGSGGAISGGVKTIGC